MRIGIIGGSFNPPHRLHKEMALNVLKNNLVDKIIYVPTGDKYAKKGLLDGTHRLEMVRLMCEDNPFLEVSDYEIKRGSSYTYETLDYFQGLYPDSEIYFILSTDLILDIMNWKKPEYILSKYKLIGLKRKGVEGILPEIYSRYPESLKTYDFKMEELSSTMIRKRIKEGKIEELKGKLDKKVLGYIEKYSLYQ